MPSGKNQHIKTRLHPRNRNRERYDLSALVKSSPELKKHISLNQFGKDSVDFSNPVAVKILNKAILHHYYGIKYWDFPDANLCPPIPGRADYIHHMADLLAENNSVNIPIGESITCLDVGVGASCIYPILGVTEYDWKFIGSDIDSASIASSEHNIESNASLRDKIDCRLQVDSTKFFDGVISKDEFIDLSICNPPFHSSIEEAEKGTRRKIKNLTGKKVQRPELNFAGINNELICEGGEYQFIKDMIIESMQYSKNCFWFSTLVSKQSHLKGIHALLEKIEPYQHKTISMGTGNKSTRIIAWTFLTKEEQVEWRKTRWKTYY